MAKPKKNLYKPETSGKQPPEIDDKFNEWKTFFGMSDKDEEIYNTWKRVTDDFHDALVGRQNSCYWYTSGEDDTAPYASNKTNGGNWDTRREIQAKIWSMYYKPTGDDTYVSNVKSSMVTGRIESTLNKLKKINLEWVAKPNHPEDKGKSKIATLVINDVFSKANAKEALAQIFKDALIYGNGFFRIYWQKKVRTVQFAETSTKDLSKEDKKQILEDSKTGAVKTRWKEPEDITVYDGIVIEPKDINSIYVDPLARCLHGAFYEARYIVERRVTSYSAFYEEFKNDADAINVDKVKSGKAFMNFSANYSFFSPPSDIMGFDSVEILEYENQYRDEYIVIVNGMLVKKIPLPQDCKELSYHKVDCITFPHQFYHIGLTDFLENTQTTQEILINAVIQKIFESMNNQMFVDKAIYGEATQAMMRENSRFIPVDTSMSPSITNKIMPMPYNPVGMDVFKLSDMLERNATIASQIDPNQASLMPDNTAATFGVMNQQQADTFISAIIDNFINTGLLAAGKQMWSLAKQKYTVPEVKKLVGNNSDEKAKMTYKNIRLEGKKIVVDGKDINISDDEEDYSFFEVKGEYLDTKEELEVTIAPDSVRIMNQGLEMQLAQQNFAQLLPFSVDPNRPESFNTLQGPPLFNALKLAQYYIDANKLPQDLLLNEDVNTGKEVIEAINETNQMLKGKAVPGQPGRTEEHKLIHQATINQIQAHIMDAETQIKEATKGVQPQIDPMTGQPMPPQLPKEVTDEMDMWQTTLGLLKSHFLTDTEPMEVAADGRNQQPQQAPPMPPASPAPNGGMPAAPTNMANAMAGGNISNQIA